MMWNRRGKLRAMRLVWAWGLLPLSGLACDQRIDVGSSLLWTARFESGHLDEWTGPAGGGTTIEPGSSALIVSNEQVHGGTYAAKMTITTSADRSLSTLDRNGGLPDEGYYSAWYYLAQTASVSNLPFQQYWSVMRFRSRSVATDPSSTRPSYDINLKSLATGQLTLRVYDVVLSTDVAMIESDPGVPVGRWFQIEAFYRNAPDSTGHLSLWLDGVLVVDVGRATGASGWVGWSVANVGADLSPATVTLYADDCAVSRVRVGPAGVLDYSQP